MALDATERDVHSFGVVVDCGGAVRGWRCDSLPATYDEAFGLALADWRRIDHSLVLRLKALANGSAIILDDTRPEPRVNNAELRSPLAARRTVGSGARG